MRKCATLLLTLMICGCAGQEKRPQLVADPSIIPAFPPAPISPLQPVPPPMLDWIRCLQAKGWQSCPGADSSPPASGATSPVPKT
jgi:hypothetical protein